DGSENPVAYARPGASIHEPVIFLRVPPQYKNNVGHFLRVVRLIPVERDGEKTGLYRERLHKELLDPLHTITAALRLEAMGSDAVGLLKGGLKSEHPLVRFAAAEALAYLDCSACGETLAELAEEHPELRTYCLAALASLNESVSHVELEKLLGSQSTDTRYGAFRGLLVLDEQDPAVRGELLNNAVWLHHVAPHTPALVHLSANRRPEVVEFGDDIRLVPPFEILAGDYTFVAGKADSCCTISRFALHKGIKRVQCGLELDDVLHALTALGGQYADVFELVQQADRSRVLTCPVAINALPQAEQVEQLARTGKDLKDTPEEIRNARTELGTTPTLFENQTTRAPGR
ncbi:MAG TPA: HEAT repeat domain-containing protein, partial [Gemmataceae bacterium]|nr:HEAT repeat domain-containing protein [Gemmataceae bacterium]